jgi:hypothetical protein
LDSDKESKISEFLQDMKDLGMGEPASQPPLSQPPVPNTSSVLPEHTSKASSRVGDDVAAQSDAGGAIDDGRGLNVVEKRLVSEWVPLELSFGIPLFDEMANRMVCEKVRMCACVHNSISTQRFC